MIKNKDLHIRFSEEELSTLKNCASQAGTNLCNYLRQAGLTGRIEQPMTSAQENTLNTLLREFHPLGGNLNQIAAKLNAGLPLSPGETDRLRELLGKNIALWQEIKELLKASLK